MSTFDPPRTQLPPVDEPPAPPPAQGASGDAGGPGPQPLIGWGLALIGAGTLWLLSLAGVSIPWAIVLPVTMITIGVLLLAGGRLIARSGLIGLGVVVTVVALVVSVTPTAVSVSAGDRAHTVTELDDLDSEYRLGAGSLTIDLRSLELPAGTTELTAGVSMGELIIHVPPEVTVEGDGRVAMGEVVAFGASRGGIAPTLTFADPGGAPDRVLVLDLRVGLGSIEVER